MMDQKKVWVAPALVVLDVDQTLNGTFPTFAESQNLGTQLNGQPGFGGS